MARLIIIDGPGLGTEYELTPSKGESTAETILGRDPRVDIPLNDNAVSREHCRIETSYTGFRLTDLDSRNKTYLNNDPVETGWLKDGDVLVIGDTELRFENDSPEVEGTAYSSTILKKVEASPGGGEEKAPPREPGAPGPTKEPGPLAGALISAASIAGLFEGFFQWISSHTGAESGMLLAREGGGWSVLADSGGKTPKGGALKADLDLVERSAKEAVVLLSKDESGKTPCYLLAAPVMTAGTIKAVAYLRSADVFGDKELEILATATGPLGINIERIDEQQRLLDENRNLLRSISEDRKLVGESQQVQEVLDFIQRAAPTPMTVLVQGETGTGKELAASALHYGSPRRGAPLVALNCAALPENLVESELFGHEKGAFTGAVARKKGRFELADGGTVFLDEVGELTLGCQSKLLRLLEERCFERVGGTTPIEVDVRIIAATNRKLQESVDNKEFREDLFYRLNVLNVVMPPLRERTEDILLLAEHFIASNPAGGRPKKLSKRAAKKLVSYSWPGNVRQLKNVVESALVLGDGKEIRPDDLILPEKSSLPGMGNWEPLSLQELERRHVLKVLEHTEGNKKRAAELLGIERCTLYSKLKNYDA
ncbi:MAG: sigma 54-interacting transcriptional regulator [Planctomycetota bacterium]|nr:sigma 54-interacting transcriptional regulator [Planctomycetota bacterium]